MGNGWYDINSFCGKGRVYELRDCYVKKLDAPYVTRYVFEKKFFVFNDNTYTGTEIYEYDENEEDEVAYIVVEFEKDHISSSFDIIGPYEITERPIKIVTNDDIVMITTTSYISCSDNYVGTKSVA